MMSESELKTADFLKLKEDYIALATEHTKLLKKYELLLEHACEALEEEKERIRISKEISRRMELVAEENEKLRMMVRVMMEEINRKSK